MTFHAVRRALDAIRAADWWAFKIPPLLVGAYAGFLVFGASRDTAAAVGAVFLAILLVAVYGYVLNDTCDVEADQASGRPNRMTTAGSVTRAALLLSAAGGALGLAATVGDSAVLELTAVHLLLPTLSSVPPIRLKGRGAWGAAADALGVHAMPMALISRAVTLHAQSQPWLPIVFMASTIGLALFAGLRGIVVHQVLDAQADRLARVSTFAGTLGVSRARALVFGRLLPCELICLAGFLKLVLPHAPVTAVVVVVFGILELLKIGRKWKLPLFEPADRSRQRYVPIVNNEVYEVWLPVGLVVDLAVVTPWVWPLVPLHVFLFFPNIRTRFDAASALWAPRTNGGPPAPTRPYTVILGATTWTLNGVNVFSSNLARLLTGYGVPTRILMTEQETDLVGVSEPMMPAPDDVTFDLLPVGPTERWGMHWGAIVRYLEEAAPCVYVPNCDWRHSAVCPRLSDQVVVVGVVHSDDPLHYDHVRRLGSYWNAVTTVSTAIAERTIAERPDVADRLTTIPIGVVIPRRFPKRRRDRDRLRVVYHGVLKQHQKRVLDFPPIVQSALDLGVPIELTIIGTGPDARALHEASAALVDRGAVRFLGVVASADIPRVLESQDVYLLVSEFEGMPNALIEAMGRGLVPVVSRMTSGIPELVIHKHNGLLAPIGDHRAFAEQLLRLWQLPQDRRRMAREAFRTVSKGRFRVEDMAEAYLDVFDRAWEQVRQGTFTRPPDLLTPPPDRVGEVNLFPVALTHDEPGVGRFEEAADVEDYNLQVGAIVAGSRHRPARPGYRPEDWRPPDLGDLRVFVSAPAWMSPGITAWSEDIVRGLRGQGVDARLLITEESTPLVTVPGVRMTLPDDLPVEYLDIRGGENWGARWGALIRLLESQAPCVYIPNDDWRHACVIPALSNRVAVVNVVHDTGPLSTDQTQRYASAWNSVVATSRDVARHLRRTLPEWRDRIVTVPHGVDVPREARRDMTGPLTVRVLGQSLTVESVAGLQTLARTLTGLDSRSQVIVVDPPESLRSPLEAAGVRIAADLNRHEWLSMCRTCGFVMGTTSAPPEEYRQIVEAVAHGCIPVQVGARTLGGLPVEEIGLVVQDWGAAARLMAVLWSDAGRRQAMVARAHEVVWPLEYRADQMVMTFSAVLDEVMQQVRAGAFQRTAAPLAPPPAEVSGLSIFAVPITHETPAGRFPSDQDAEAFEQERRLEPTEKQVQA